MVRRGMGNLKSHCLWCRNSKLQTSKGICVLGSGTLLWSLLVTLCNVSVYHCVSFHEKARPRLWQSCSWHPRWVLGPQKVWVCRGQLWEALVLQAGSVHQDAPVSLATIFFTTSIGSVEQLDSNKSLRYQISTSVPNTLNYPQALDTRQT